MNLFSKRPLALVSLLFLLTSLFGYLLNANGMSRLFGFIPFVVFLLIAVLLALLRRKGRFLLPLCVAAVLLFGFLIQCLYDDVRHRPWREANAGTPHTLTGTVTERKAEDDEIVYTLSVTELDSRAVHLRLFLRAGSNAVPHSVGTHLQCDVTVLEQTDPFYYREGIAGTADALSVTAIGRKEQPILNAFTTLRTRLSDRIREGMNGEAAALTVALLLGEKEGLSGSLKNDFQRTGLSHMLALSGLHLSILAMLLLRLLEGLGTPRFVSFPLLILFLLAYTTISGFPLSLIRAALMLTVAELGKLFRLGTDSVTSLFFSVALIVLFSPSAIADIGLLLSFLATLGILTLIEVFPRRPRSIIGKALSALLLSLLSTVFAVAFTLPVTAVVFGGVSLVSPLSNLLTSPLLHLVLIIGPLLLLFPTIFSPIVQAVGDLTIDTVKGLSEIRGIYLFTSYPLFILALLLFSLYLLFLLLRRKDRRGFLVRFLPSVAILISVLIGCHLFETNKEHLLYTRRGTEEYITLRTEGRTTVISHAEKQTSIFLLEEELATHHIPEIDLLVLSCYEADTASYLEALTERITVHSLLLVPPNEESAHYRAVLYTAKRLKIPHNVKETIQESGVSFGFVNIEDTAEEHSGLFWRASYRDTEVRYATQGYLQTVEREVLGIFLGEADLLILGAHAACEEAASRIPTPSDLTVIVADPESAPTNWQKEKEGVVLSPDTFVYQLP